MAITHKAAAVVSVGTYLAWESTATLRLLGSARGAWTAEERGGGILCRHAHSLFESTVISMAHHVILDLNFSQLFCLLFRPFTLLGELVSNCELTKQTKFRSVL